MTYFPLNTKTAVQNNEKNVYFSTYQKEKCISFTSFEAEQAEIENFVKKRLKRSAIY